MDVKTPEIIALEKRLAIQAKDLEYMKQVLVEMTETRKKSFNSGVKGAKLGTVHFNIYVQDNSNGKYAPVVRMQPAGQAQMVTMWPDIEDVRAMKTMLSLFLENWDKNSEL